MSKLKVTVGGSLAEDAAAFVSAWGKAERGEEVADHVLAFESWVQTNAPRAPIATTPLGLHALEVVAGYLDA